MTEKVYFIGIGGIGMSAIARYCKAKGCEVSGYDRTPSPLTERLCAEGIAVHYEDDCSKIPADKENCTVIYTPAIPQELGEMQYVRREAYCLLKRSRMLGELSRGMHTLAVAGTHGKTTTSTLLGHIFQNSGKGCNAFLGGISKNYDTNLLIADNDVFVAEADEFDRSFLQLFPEIAVITAMDADHLDIYGDLAHVQEAFRAFASQVSGALIAKYGLPLKATDTPARLMTYSMEETGADFFASGLSLDPYGHFTFDLHHPGGCISGIRCGVPGIVNVENSVAAAAAALCFGVSGDKVKAAIGNYKGVKRRFDIHFNNGSRVYLDDYAHHPAELAAAVRSIRGMFPGRRLTAVFQPHLYTRTRDFAAEFSEALSAVDTLVLLDIYPARELPIPGVSSELIYDGVKGPDKLMLSKGQLLDWLKANDTEVLVTFGAGDIDRLVDAVTTLMEEKYK